MKQRIKEMIALLLALSLVISAPGAHARAFEGDIQDEVFDEITVEAEASAVKADDIYLSTQYYVNDKFEQAYELKKKEYKAFGIKWNGNDLQGTTRRLSEGSVIRREDILPVVSVSGAYSEEDTEKYANNILSLVKIEAGATTTYLTEEGFKVPGETSVTLFLDQNDICPEKLEPGYDKLTELEQMGVRNEWANEIYPVWDNVRIRAEVVKNAINDDDPKSGMENTLPIFPISDNVFRVTMVKGQTYSFGAGKWTSDNAKIVSVGKANGKAYSCTVSVTDVYNKKTSYGIPTQFGLDKAGKVTALKVGSTEISCTYNGSVYKTTVQQLHSLMKTE